MCDDGDCYHHDDDCEDEYFVDEHFRISHLDAYNLEQLYNFGVCPFTGDFLDEKYVQSFVMIMFGRDHKGCWIRIFFSEDHTKLSLKDLLTSESYRYFTENVKTKGNIIFARINPFPEPQKEKYKRR